MSFPRLERTQCIQLIFGFNGRSLLDPSKSQSRLSSRMTLFRNRTEVVKVMSGKLIAFRGRERRLPPGEAEALAKDILGIAVPERVKGVGKPRLEDPELLLSICDVLRRRYNTSPASVRADAEFFHRFLETPNRKIGLYDEKEYFLGELSLIAGTACRVLFHRDAARRWFDRAESRFVLTENASAHIARLAYQRLALRIEERQLDEVLELAPRWREAFVRLELKEDALKCRFLEAVALQELDKSAEAIEVLNSASREAEALGNVKLHAQALGNLAQYYRTLGDLKEALTNGQKALPLLQQV